MILGVRGDQRIVIRGVYEVGRFRSERVIKVVMMGKVSY